MLPNAPCSGEEKPKKEEEESESQRPLVAATDAHRYSDVNVRLGAAGAQDLHGLQGRPCCPSLRFSIWLTALTIHRYLKISPEKLLSVQSSQLLANRDTTRKSNLLDEYNWKPRARGLLFARHTQHSESSVDN